MVDSDTRKTIFYVTILILIDQAIKFLTIDINYTILDTYFLSIGLIYAKNYGVAYGLFSGMHYFIIFATLIILYFLIKYRAEIKQIPFILIFSGGVGNLLDRIFFGYVNDMFYLRIIFFEFNIFNPADIMISLGIVMVIYDLMKISNHK